jgi:hypothetical protein
MEKSEIRISKSETNSKFKRSKTANEEKSFEFGTIKTITQRKRPGKDKKGRAFPALPC